MDKKITIALIGNPNSGKTTMFNDITGSSQYVGNWPGVTVEKKEGKLRKHKDVLIQDLPGVYSLSPYTPEEVVTRDYLIDVRPDAVINIIDATNIERSLYLTTQVLEANLPTVIALNMMDVADKQGIKVNTEELSKRLGCPVVKMSAIRSEGIMDAAKLALKLAHDNAGRGAGANAAKAAKNAEMQFSEEIETIISEIQDITRADRYTAIKLFERDEPITKRIFADVPSKVTEKSASLRIDEIIEIAETRHDEESEFIITNERYNLVESLVKDTVKKRNLGSLSTSDKIDRIVTNRILALPIFIAVMFLVYFLSINTVGGFLTGWVNDNLFGEYIPGAVSTLLGSLHVAPWLDALILDGIVAGVGAVLGFLPQMMVLFLCLAILEDCGYMARIAFIMDKFFRRFGLSGKSFIPILIGTGCGVPGVMASRTIESESDRRMTIITTTFIPCGAKLPIIALIAGALFHGNPWIAPSAYFIGIAAIIISGIMLKKTSGFDGDASPFVMELPSYHLPKAKSILIHMWDRSKAFVKKAGTIILLAVVGVWFLSTFNFKLQMVDTSDSILAAIGKIIAPIFTPLGWGEWRAAVAAITGLIAKENVVGTFGVLYGVAEASEDGAEYWSQLQAALPALAGYSFLVFNLLCAPCFAAIGAIRREMNSAKWTWFAIGYQTGFAYIVAMIIYQIGTLVSGGGFGVATVVAILFIAAILFMLLRKPSAYKAKEARLSENVA